MHFVPKKMYKWGERIWNHLYLVLPTCLKNSPRWRLRCNGLAGGRGGDCILKYRFSFTTGIFPPKIEPQGLREKFLLHSQSPNHRKAKKNGFWCFFDGFFHLYASHKRRE